MNWLTAKVAQGIALALLALCVALGARSCSLSSDLKVAASAAAAAASARDAAVTERDSWKAKTADALAANRAYGEVIKQMQDAETARQQQAAAIAERAGQLIAAAKVDADRARRERDDFKRRFAAKPPTCAAALDAMQAACPTLRNY